MIEKIMSMLGGGKKDPLIELSGLLNIGYFQEREGHPPFISGIYANRGVTIDLLNDKGYFDQWHPHTRIVVSMNNPRRETHVVSKRGTFFSRKLGEVEVANPRFSDKYVLLSSNPTRAKKLITEQVTNWAVNLEMQFKMEGNQITYHQEKEIDDVERIRHILDALVYVAASSDNLK